MPSSRLPVGLPGRRLGPLAGTIAIVAWLSMALTAGVAHAYRPFDLTDADVAKRHNFEIELGPAEYVAVGATHSLRAPNLSINYGLATGRELSLEGANLVALNPAPDEPPAQIEGGALAMKQVLRRGSLQDVHGASIALEGEMLFPERGDAHLGAGANLLASSASKHGTTHFNLGAERQPDGLNAGSGGVIFEAGDKFGVAPAVELKLAVVEHGLPEQSVIFGLIYVPGKETEYDLALRLARSGDENTLEVRAGLTWQMSVHRVVEEAESALGIPHQRRRH